MEPQENSQAQPIVQNEAVPPFLVKLWAARKHLLLATILLGFLVAAVCAVWQSPMLLPIAPGQDSPLTPGQDYVSRKAVVQFIFALIALVFSFAMVGAALVPHAFNSALPPLSNEGRTATEWAATFAGAMLFGALALGVASVFKAVVHPDWSPMTAGVFDLAETAAGYLVASVGASLPLGLLAAKLVNKTPSAAP